MSKKIIIFLGALILLIILLLGVSTIQKTQSEDSYPETIILDKDGYQVEPTTSPTEDETNKKMGLEQLKNYKVTAAGKTTVTAITAAIVSYILKIGPITSAFDTIILENCSNTGYFRTSQRSRMDTNPGYVQRSPKVTLYKDAARTNLLSYENNTQ